MVVRDGAAGTTVLAQDEIERVVGWRPVLIVVVW